MGDIDCESWDESPECFSFDDPPEFVRPPPSFFCDGSFDEQFTCSNEIPFPFQINTDRITEEPTLAVALVCSILFSVILTVSGVLLWRNKQRVRNYFRCFGSSSDSTRKSTPSAASTSDGSDGGYNIDYRKKALLSSISPPSGVKFLTESAIRYAPHQQTHLTLDGGHIYEEIPNNYPPFYCQTGAGHSHYAVNRDGATIFAHHNIFQQRQSWMDLLQRPPCPDIAPNLYLDGVKTAACPNCYYPSLPRDSSRISSSRHTLNVVANPVAALNSARGKRTRTERSAPYQFPTYLPSDCSSGVQTFMGVPQHRKDFSLVHNDLREMECDTISERTRTLDSAQRHRQHKRYKHTNQDGSGITGASNSNVSHNEMQLNAPLHHIH